MNLQFFLFIFIGIINTSITLFVIFALRYFNFSIYLANAFGYILGVISSFLLNSKFTFGVDFALFRFYKFIATVLISYILNIAFIKVIILSFNVHEIYAQLGGMVIYTGSCFIINKLWVMR